MAASWTPCERSPTSSLLGQRVAAMRWRKSSICSSGTLMWNGPIAAAVSTVVLMTTSVLERPRGRPYAFRSGRAIADTESSPEAVRRARRTGGRVVDAAGDALESPSKSYGPSGFVGLDALCGARKATPSLARGRSNRHDPYHALETATGRNARQRFWLVWAVCRVMRFATGWHRLQPRGSIKAPYFVATLGDTAHLWVNVRRAPFSRSRAGSSDPAGDPRRAEERQRARGDVVRRAGLAGRTPARPARWARWSRGAARLRVRGRPARRACWSRGARSRRLRSGRCCRRQGGGLSRAWGR